MKVPPEKGRSKLMDHNEAITGVVMEQMYPVEMCPSADISEKIAGQN